MELQTINYLQLFSFIFLGGAIALPALILNIRLAPRLGLIDWPKARGVAEEQIPIVGHSLVLLSLGALLVLTRGNQPVLIWTSFVMGMMGYFDDRRPISAFDKIFFQLVCVCSMVCLDPQIQVAITNKYGSWGIFWAIFFILGLTNAINFVDGIDGLAGLVILIGSAGFILYGSYTSANPALMLYSALLIGMLVPFLYLNVVKRKGFLGNVGSYFFAYLLAVMHLSLPMDVREPIARVSISGLAFLIPIADGTMVTLVRIWSLRSPFTADKGHLHHRMVQTSIPLRYLLAVFGTLEILTLMVGVVLVKHSSGIMNILPPFLCISHIAITAILILMIDWASKRRLQFYFERLDAGEPIYFMKYAFTRQDGTPVTPLILRRLEARVSAEVRISDLCYSERPNRLFVSIRAEPVPLKGIGDRLESIFQAERVVATLEVEEGEFLKVSRASRKTRFKKERTPAKPSHRKAA